MRKLRKIRKGRGYSLVQASEILGIDASHLSRIERGLQRPSPDVAELLSKLFGVSEIQLLYPERFQNKD